MKKMYFILFLCLCYQMSFSQIRNKILITHLLEFKTERQAEYIAEKLWQVEVEVDVEEGFCEGERRYYIELKDISILDIEIEKGGKYKRYFNEKLKENLIKRVEIIRGGK